MPQSIMSHSTKQDPNPNEPDVEERIRAVLQHLGIERAHVAARMPQDWVGLLRNCTDLVAGVALLFPAFITHEAIAAVADRVAVFSNDMPPSGDAIQRAMGQHAAARHVLFPEYETRLWTDVVRDHGERTLAELLQVAQRAQAEMDVPPVSLPSGRGEVAGITFDIGGQGAPLLLFPLGLAPSGWNPLLEQLQVHFCTIVLGGPQLGMLPLLERRGNSPGYQQMLATLFAGIDLHPGESVLEVGSGTGVIDRWLARRTDGQNPITGVDINAYLRAEAADLVRRERLEQIIEFREGNAEELPFPDNSFDVSFSVTVMEEVDADRMLAEMIRVTRPGGRVGVIVRAMDLPYLINAPIPAHLRGQFEQPQPLQEGRSCASRSLYRRFARSSLVVTHASPCFATFHQPYGVVEQFMQAGFIANLAPADAAAWHEGVAQAAADGSFLITWPHHWAVGTVPL